MSYKKSTLTSLSALLLSGVIVASGVNAASADDGNSPPPDAVELAPSNDQVVNAEGESLSVRLDDGSGSVAAENGSAEDASITYDLASGASLDGNAEGLVDSGTA